MRRAPSPGAIVEIGDGDGRITTLKSFTCNHCGSPKIIPEGAKVEDHSDICRGCWRLVCAACADRQARARRADGRICTPFEMQIEAIERRDRMRRDMGLGP